MNPERMKERGAHFTYRDSYKLKGYSLRFNKISLKKPHTGCANIVPDEAGIVEGVLYKITVQGLYNLDKFEGYPVHYDRVGLYIDIGGSQEVVKTYITMPDKIGEGLHPSKSYLDHLLKAKDCLSPEYYDYIRSIRTFD